MHVAFVGDPADIDRVRQDFADVTPAQRTPAGRSARAIDADGKPEIFGIYELFEPTTLPASR